MHESTSTTLIDPMVNEEPWRYTFFFNKQEKNMQESVEYWVMQFFFSSGLFMHAMASDIAETLLNLLQK